MQVTKELIDQDIKGMEAQQKSLEVSLAQTSGALTTLRAIRDFLDRPEPEVAKKAEVEVEVEAEDYTKISDANQEVQDRVAAQQAARADALSESELAELVAGSGAVVEAIEPLKVVNASGRYEEKEAV